MSVDCCLLPDLSFLVMNFSTLTTIIADNHHHFYASESSNAVLIIIDDCNKLFYPLLQSGNRLLLSSNRLL